jgi:hypothetical protein
MIMTWLFPGTKSLVGGTNKMSEPFKPQLRLVIQASVPVEEIIEGEELYRQLKELLVNYSENCTINGQLVKILEPCCKDRKEIQNAQHNSKVA